MRPFLTRHLICLIFMIIFISQLFRQMNRDHIPGIPARIQALVKAPQDQSGRSGSRQSFSALFLYRINLYLNPLIVSRIRGCSFDTFIRCSLSLLIVARRASQASQSSPQYAIYSFMIKSSDILPIHVLSRLIHQDILCQIASR